MPVIASADPLGDRMKNYEQQLRQRIDPNQFVVIRLDGRAFHTWTKGLQRPYDLRLVETMAQTTAALCQEAGISLFAYQQSDEISLLLSDRAREETQMWFGGNVQKLVSVSASYVTGLFARAYPERGLAQFDARVLVLPNAVEVANYFRWRQADAQRNAISMVAEAHFSHRQLHGVSTHGRREMLLAAGVDLAALEPRFMDGQLCYPATRREQVPYTDKRTGEEHLSPLVDRRVWTTVAAPRLDANADGWVLQQLAEREQLAQ